MFFIRIVLLCILAAICYGILHDQITARISIEYFTVGHPLLIPTDSPTLQGLLWGIIATWWVGLILGVPLAMVACFGTRPQIAFREIIRFLLNLMLVMASCAVASGLFGYIAACNGWVHLVEPFQSEIALDRQNPFIVALWMHSASYLSGFAGGIVVIALTWRRRFRKASSL